MKTFRFPLGHEEGKTMTAGELKGILSMYPDKMPVPTGFAEIVGDYFPVLHATASSLGGPRLLSSQLRSQRLLASIFSIWPKTFTVSPET